MPTDHWGVTVQTGSLAAEEPAPLRRLSAGPDRFPIRGPADQRRLREAPTARGRLRDEVADGTPARTEDGPPDEPSARGGDIG